MGSFCGTKAEMCIHDNPPFFKILRLEKMLYWRFHCSIQTANSIKQSHETIVHKELVIVR
jgi:hypothetical protein